MKKTILALAMLFSIVITSQEKFIDGIWEDEKFSSYTIITCEEGYGVCDVISFEWAAGINKERVIKSEWNLDTNSRVIKTQIRRSYGISEKEYILVNDNLLKVKFSGRYDRIYTMKRREIK
jgi:hypothetical protein